MRVRSGDLSVWGGTLLTGSTQMWIKGRLARVRGRSQASCLPGADAHFCLCFKSLSLVMPVHKLRRWRLMQGSICVCRLVARRCVYVCEGKKKKGINTLHKNIRQHDRGLRLYYNENVCLLHRNKHPTGFVYHLIRWEIITKRPCCK